MSIFFCACSFFYVFLPWSFFFYLSCFLLSFRAQLCSLLDTARAISRVRPFLTGRSRTHGEAGEKQDTSDLLVLATLAVSALMLEYWSPDPNPISSYPSLSTKISITLLTHPIRAHNPQYPSSPPRLFSIAGLRELLVFVLNGARY